MATDWAVTHREIVNALPAGIRDDFLLPEDRSLSNRTIYRQTAPPIAPVRGSIWVCPLQGIYKWDHETETWHTYDPSFT